ncbi:MAG: ATP-binding cassette domain-containing protein, partial [Caulobacterales bacterium]|nr:ATP-binding cassette domain-containing protein [Caulobacterales bacterium]
MAAIEFADVGKRYGEVEVIRGLDLSIRDEEFMVFVGPSGCGKSTALRMIAGLEEVSSGEVSIGDRVVNDVEPKDRDVAMVFQSYALYPHMSVRDNIAFGLKIRRIDPGEIARRVASAADILGLDAVLDRKPKALSGGQRQRVALGRAIVRDPSVFLFDEPLSNLDAKLRRRVRQDIRDLQQELGLTSVYVTHDQEEALAVSDRIIVMNQAVIAQEGSPRELYEQPADRFVADFIGDANLVPVRIESVDGDVATVDAGGLTLHLPSRGLAAGEATAA